MKVRAVLPMLAVAAVLVCGPRTPPKPVVPDPPDFWVAHLVGRAPFSTRVAGRDCPVGTSVFMFISPMNVEPVLAGQGVVSADGIWRMTVRSSLPPGSYTLDGFCGAGGSAAGYGPKTVTIKPSYRRY